MFTDKDKLLKLKASYNLTLKRIEIFVFIKPGIRRLTSKSQHSPNSAIDSRKHNTYFHNILRT